MQKREDTWRKKYEKVHINENFIVKRLFTDLFFLNFFQELERRRKFQDLYYNISKEKIPMFGSPDAEVNTDR